MRRLAGGGIEDTDLDSAWIYLLLYLLEERLPLQGHVWGFARALNSWKPRERAQFPPSIAFHPKSFGSRRRLSFRASGSAKEPRFWVFLWRCEVSGYNSE